MSLGTPASCAGSPVDEICARCGRSLESASLLLVCEHHLCLQCAAESLEKRGTHVVQCKACNAVTEVDAAAASYLESLCSLSPSSTRLASGFASPAVQTSRDLSDDTSPMVLPPPIPQPARRKEPRWSNRAVDAPGTERLGKTKLGAAVRSQPSVSPNSPSSVIESMEKVPQGDARCGQCEDGPAEIYCDQCQETFCKGCSDATHRQGRMTKHCLQTVTSELCKPGARAPPMAAPSLSRRFHACPEHPEEPVNYFCLDCESSCVCAECCLHGKHRGHSVQCVLKAVCMLPDRAEELLSATRIESKRLASMVKHLSEKRLEAAKLVQRGTEDLQTSLREVALVAQKEESTLMQEADTRASETVRLQRQEEQEGRLAEAYRQLSEFFQVGDAVPALKWYARLQKELRSPDRVAGAAALQQVRLQQSSFSRTCCRLKEVTNRVASVKAPQAEVMLPPQSG
ncbi:Trim28 [Symbiodinium microadriaticum]|nr:Trim28 [Symbiodinium sp. KB8]CAE7666312.1 Trim28 [Symbiodinium microadriaticum]